MAVKLAGSAPTVSWVRSSKVSLVLADDGVIGAFDGAAYAVGRYFISIGRLVGTGYRYAMYPAMLSINTPPAKAADFIVFIEFLLNRIGARAYTTRQGE
jgi:hypothetical protein